MKKYYATYRWLEMGGLGKPHAIECESFEQARDVASDICSYHGIRYVSINSCGRLKKGTVILSYADYNSPKFTSL